MHIHFRYVCFRQAESKPKRQKLNESEKLENEYEIDSSNKAEPTMVELLPIKTKTGVMFQSIMKDDQGIKVI